MLDTPKSRSILNMYGLDEASLTPSLEKLPSTGRDALRQVVATKVQDKSGFYVAMLNVVEGGTPAPLGDLENVVVNGDVASGRAKKTVADPGSPSQSSQYDQDFAFRRLNGGWLLDAP
jgi:hypothetical protein